MRIFLTNFIIVLLLTSCKKNEDKDSLTLEVLNDTLISYPFGSNRDTINIINYTIANTSDQIYYFKQGVGDDLLMKKIYKNGMYISIFELANNKEVSYSEKLAYEHNIKSSCDSCSTLLQSIRLNNDLERLKEQTKSSYYSTKDKRHYFFIHPKEKLYFKQYVNLTDSMRYEDTRMNYAHLQKNIRYYAAFSIPSDSSNYKQDLPDDILKTIRVNNVKFYNGILKSKNKVPVKVVE